MSAYRPELPPMPARIGRLPIARGYPVPWFVAWLNDGKQPVARGTGEPDFRVLAPGSVEQALAQGLCWICGESLTPPTVAFVVGPMCAVNRTSAEPPSHVICADWAARACPFLSRPHAMRREAGMPEDAIEAPGIPLMRNPGVALVWLTRTPTYRPVAHGFLFDPGDPVQVRWYAEGREATHDEIMTSIDSGLPALREIAEQDEGGLEALAEALSEALQLVPA